MKHLSWVRGVSKAAGIVCAILKVMSLIGAISLVVCVLALSFLPPSLFQAELKQGFVVKINYAEYFSEEEWESVKESILELEEDESLAVTDKGLEVKSDLSALTVTNRSLSLLILPSFVALLVSFPLFRFLQRAAKELSESPCPFSRKAAEELRRAGITVWVLAGAPALCSTLVAIMTSGAIAPNQELDLTVVLFGFLLFGLSHLLEYGAELAETAPPSFENDPNAF